MLNSRRPEAPAGMTSLAANLDKQPAVALANGGGHPVEPSAVVRDRPYTLGNCQGSRRS